ncbi:50S ribosomal protein L18 [candidate division KSB1 bacterium]|nr:50S ribosomal protein L18 [candidate division KSB1 bacterium]
MNEKSSVRTERRKRIKKRIHKKIAGTSERPRLVVFRSLRSIYAQLVDDSSSRTLCSVSSQSKDLKSEVAKAKGKTEAAKIIGKSLAEKAKGLKIEQVVFDRNGFLYHGRVKAVAEGAREAGLKF